MTPYLEIGGEYREVIPGAWLVELPLPFSLGLINVYLLRMAEGWMLVDCGMDTPNCRAALERALEGMGVGWRDIRILLLTHFHPDHAGLARYVAARSGARLHLHGADQDLLAEICDEPRYDSWIAGVYAAAGVPEGMAAAVSLAMRQIGAGLRPLVPDVRLEGGETLAGAHGEWRVAWTPGHAPGHVCLHSAAQRALISGDHVLEHVSPNVSWLPGADSLGACLESLDAIARLDADLVLPSHGQPFSGHREWADRARRQHLERSARIAGLLADRERTAHQMVGELWPRELLPLHYRFGLFEVMAHLERLRRLGAARVETRQGVEQWRVEPAGYASLQGAR